MREQQRELSRRQRASARSLGSAFPQVENVRIELTFEAPAGRDPARQSHMLYPAAPAYFRFDCPLGDCDGGFDLNAAALSLLEHASELGDGTLQCRGSRPGAAALPERARRGRRWRSARSTGRPGRRPA